MAYLLGVICFSCLLGYLCTKEDAPEKINPLTNKEKALIKSRIKDLSGREFEIFSSEVYKLLGYKVILTNATNDRGRDIVINKNGEKIFVECKNHTKHNSIGRPEAQKLCGAMVANNVSKGVILSVNGVNKNCNDYCKSIRGKTVKIDSIECINITEFLELCSELDSKKVFRVLGIINNKTDKCEEA
ncbi:restriction endonuclease [Clostridium taeniosporum]|uniref:Restriction endonuclease n=1 Tax=Clostridium taeniosporum TaxID=394958 RepID=A0A1D7XLC7_9CLOT|nr:restriction endonuclease [Clostridium taeniosporum]AOR24131.1 restriction endonuclease [Clostridium taeniosporum]